MAGAGVAADSVDAVSMLTDSFWIHVPPYNRLGGRDKTKPNFGKQQKLQTVRVTLKKDYYCSYFYAFLPSLS